MSAMQVVNGVISGARLTAKASEVVKPIISLFTPMTRYAKPENTTVALISYWYSFTSLPSQTRLQSTSGKTIIGITY